MSTLRNIPQCQVKDIKGLIDIRENQVVSMTLSKSDNVQIAMFAFSAGETVSEEAYFGDTLYIVLEGSTKVGFEGKEFPIKEGQVIMIPAGTLHEIGGPSAFKMMQITINN